MWDYKKAGIKKIWQSFICQLGNIRYKNPNNQVNFLTNCIINNFPNFCPSKIITCRYKDAPWITSEIKQKYKEKTKIYKKYVKNKHNSEYKQLLDDKILETGNFIKITKERYYSEFGRELIDPSVGPKMYWSI